MFGRWFMEIEEISPPLGKGLIVICATNQPAVALKEAARLCSLLFLPTRLFPLSCFVPQKAKKSPAAVSQEAVEAEYTCKQEGEKGAETQNTFRSSASSIAAVGFVLNCKYK